MAPDEKKKILIIDDDPDIVYTIKEICTFAGYEAVTANEGLEGVSLFKEERPNLVIVDYHMPKYDGVRTVKKIRQVDEAVAILVLTVDERQEVMDQFLAVGATDFSLKPVKAPDLIARINVNMQINAMHLKQLKEEAAVYVEKGISQGNLETICGYMRSEGKAKTIKEISAGVSLAYQTVHRYIQFLLDQKQVEIVTKHGKVGRPLNYYKIKEQ